jgi:hypothetical protein
MIPTTEKIPKSMAEKFAAITALLILSVKSISMKNTE